MFKIFGFRVDIYIGVAKLRGKEPGMNDRVICLPLFPEIGDERDNTDIYFFLESSFLPLAGPRK